MFSHIIRIHGSAEERWNVRTSLQAAAPALDDEQSQGIYSVGGTGATTTGMGSGVRPPSPMAKVPGAQWRDQLDSAIEPFRSGECEGAAGVRALCSPMDPHEGKGATSGNGRGQQADGRWRLVGPGASAPVLQARLLERPSLPVQAHGGIVDGVQILVKIQEL